MPDQKILLCMVDGEKCILLLSEVYQNFLGSKDKNLIIHFGFEAKNDNIGVDHLRLRSLRCSVSLLSFQLFHNTLTLRKLCQTGEPNMFVLNIDKMNNMYYVYVI